YKRHSDGSIRDSAGHFAGNSGVIPGTPGVDAVEGYLVSDGYVIKGREIGVRSSDGKLRKYDIVAIDSSDVCIGIEVKSGTAVRTRQQINIDTELKCSGGMDTVGNNAKNAGVTRIDDVNVIYVDRQGNITKVEVD
ncbi:MAG: hypothetical protein IIT65_10360, partial [Lachnospiraceae bacterium]|nr:hypothetical protein [Lachnospiraceae bacterium]